MMWLFNWLKLYFSRQILPSKLCPLCLEEKLIPEKTAHWKYVALNEHGEPTDYTIDVCYKCSFHLHAAQETNSLAFSPPEIKEEDDD
jgi:transcription initiation factor IIF auxiliary subunit